MDAMNRDFGKRLRLAALGLAAAVALAVAARPFLAPKPYVITDGSRTFTCETAASDPEAVLRQAGVTLGQGDFFTVAENTITLHRAQRVRLLHHGEETTLYAYDETVEALLARRGISLEESDRLTPAAQTRTWEGMTIRVDRVERREQTYSANVPHDTVYCNDPTLPRGSQTCITPGVDGELLCTAAVTYINGAERVRQLLTQSLTTAPVTEVIAVGTGKNEPINPEGLPLISDNTITLPTGEVLTYTGTMQVGATAYFCNPWDRGLTAIGTKARVGAIAVDPNVIPYGTRMFIISNDGDYVYGIATAEDCGDPRYIGGNRVDLYYNTQEECVQFGFRRCTVYFLGTP